MTSVISFGNGSYNPKFEKYIPSNDGVQIQLKGFNDIHISKAKNTFTCGCCGKECVPKTRFVGHYWDKVCYNCLSEWLEKSKITFQNFIEMFEKIKLELEENKSHWDKEVVVSAI